MKTPTLDDIRVLFLQEPAVYAALTAYGYGGMSLEEALMMAIIAMAEELRALHQAHKELLERQPSIR